MNAMDINIARYLPILREQTKQAKRDAKRKIQKDKDLKKLAREVLKSGILNKTK